MHWNNGTFHENIHVENTIYITKHKYPAVYGNKDTVHFGGYSANTNLFGKNIIINSNGTLTTKSLYETQIFSNESIIIETNEENYSFIKPVDINMAFYTHGAMLINAQRYINITSNSSNVNIASTNAKVELIANDGIVFYDYRREKIYGTRLPDVMENGEVKVQEGQIFFKLIS